MRAENPPQVIPGGWQLRALVDGLLQKGFKYWIEADGLIEYRIGARLIRAYGQQIAGALVARVILLELAHLAELCGIDQIGGDTRNRLLDVDGGVVPGVGQLPAEHDVAIEDGTV